jgi:hypothetical protein
MPCAAFGCVMGGSCNVSSVVDIFTVTSRTWTTAALREARSGLAATSLPDAGVAFFSGGYSTSYYVFSRCCKMGVSVRGMREWE